MSPELRAEPAPTFHHVGDVVGVQFSQEEELVLYIPDSGDVLLCAASQWHALRQAPGECSADKLPLSWPVDRPEDFREADDLRSILRGLGARLAWRPLPVADLARVLRP